MRLTLKILAGKHVGKELRITKEQFLIGRGEDCHLRALSSEVSRHHCQIALDERGAFISDLGSTNGTYINGRRITQTEPLHSGDVLIVGPLMFEAQLPRQPSQIAEPETSEWAIGDSEVVNLVEDPDDPDLAVAASRTRLLGADELAELVSRDLNPDLAGPDPSHLGNLSLTQQLIVTVETYRQKFPHTSWEDVCSALREMLDWARSRNAQ